jgi:hypothetical protein
MAGGFRPHTRFEDGVRIADDFIYIFGGSGMTVGEYLSCGGILDGDAMM